jgi:opacity protein-like surface antigen
MKTRLIAAGVLALGLVVSSSAAYAQDPPPPIPEARMYLDLQLVGAIPQGDLDNEGSIIETSGGLRAAFGYTVAHNISIHGALRYVLVQLDADVPDDYSAWYYDVGIGGRYTFPVAQTFRIFGELELLYAVVGEDDGEDSSSDSGFGFALAGGGYFLLTPSIGLGGQIRYSAASIEVGEGDFTADVDVDWLAIEAGITILFQ